MPLRSKLCVRKKGLERRGEQGWAGNKREERRE
jgi:hypothetical protein